MDKETLKSMALRIKNHRKALGYTQAEMAEKTGISESAYTKIENAFQTPSLDTLIKISSELSLSMDYIIWGTGNKILTR